MGARTHQTAVPVSSRNNERSSDETPFFSQTLGVVRRRAPNVLLILPDELTQRIGEVQQIAQ